MADVEACEQFIEDLPPTRPLVSRLVRGHVLPLPLGNGWGEGTLELVNGNVVDRRIWRAIAALA